MKVHSDHICEEPHKQNNSKTNTELLRDLAQIMGHVPSFHTRTHTTYINMDFYDAGKP